MRADAPLPIWTKTVEWVIRAGVWTTPSLAFRNWNSYYWRRIDPRKGGCIKAKGGTPRADG